jgi:ABC-type lipoprotein release transport system permease subunit
MLGRTLASLLYGVRARDGASFMAVAALLLIVTGLAAWLPARSAVRVDPARVLRG